MITEIKYVFSFFNKKNAHISIYGGSEYKLKNLSFVPDLVIQADDLNSFAASKTKVLYKANNEALNFLPKHLIPTSFSHLIIDWEDFDTPPLYKDWWENLLEFFNQSETDLHIVFCCTGGTGRTGTMLSIVYALSGMCAKKEDPVETIRNLYKVTAVETDEQIEYISDITDRYIKTTPSFLYFNDVKDI